MFQSFNYDVERRGKPENHTATKFEALKVESCVANKFRKTWRFEERFDVFVVKYK